jgi:NAD(P)H-nitrite reductase large subunit
MWFGRCYRVNDVIVDTFTTALDDTLRLLDALCAANRASACCGECCPK